ncbi:MAG: nickel-dependent lactate racemase [Calditrichaeota bacterium]|nr:MAG: nickel-dependent lactate racemase [Calditrichota bacterium]
MEKDTRLNDIDLKYGHISLKIALPQVSRWQKLQKPVPVFPSQDVLVKEGVITLISRLELAGAKNASLLLIVPDHTRKCNLAFILTHLLEKLEQHFSPSIEILIANGSHILQPQSVIQELVGADIYARYRVHQHDAKAVDQLESFGQSSNGTEILLNKKVKQADVVITVGGILYHYFAGFGGGAKMLLPGVAGYETIRQNHCRTIDPLTGRFHVSCQEGHIENNPVFSDLQEVLRIVPHALSLQVVLSPHDQIVACQAGPIQDVHRSLLPVVEMLYSLPIEEQADIVIADAGGFPADVNLIQAHKAIHHACQAVKPEGCLFIAAECCEGIGSATFLPAFQHGDAENMGKELVQNYQINSHTALSLREKAEKIKIFFLSQLDPAIVRMTGLIPLSSPEETRVMLGRVAEKHHFGYILPQANLYLPKLFRDN